MTVLKVLLTLLLAALLLVTCVACELLAAARQTALQPTFYDARQQGAYLCVARALLRDWSGLVLANAPAEALRTTDREEAYTLAAAALPPERIAAVLAGSLPDIVHWALQGGAPPVLLGAKGFPAMADDLIAALLKPGVWQSLQQKPSLPIEIPFTPAWNDENAPALDRELIVPRYWAAVYDNALLVAVGLAVLLVVLLWVLWRRRRGVFCVALGIVLAFNALLLVGPVVLVTYYSAWAFGQIAAQPQALPVVGFLAQDFAPLCRAVLEPLRGAVAVAALVLASFALTSFTCGMDRRLATTKEERHNREVVAR